MLLKKWEDLPAFMQTEEVKAYYDVLQKKKAGLFFKRAFDVMISLLMLILLSPVFLILAIAIKIDSKGPVFFRQVRVTQYGKKFRIFKFRTMVQNADKLGAQVTTQGDARITRVGKLIRKCRLDEICQLIDVFRGTMTFVGTRPEVPKYVDKYTAEMNATLLLPAGVTSETSIYYKDEDELLAGASDVDKAYVEEVLPQKMHYNLKSVKKFGFWRDIKIMFMTVFAVLGKEYKAEETKSATSGKPSLLTSARAFFNSCTFYVLETLVAVAFVLFRQEVAGVIAFAGLIMFLLVLCEDILPTTLPFLLLCTFATNCYDSFDTFMSYAIFAPVVVTAFLAHYIVYHKPYKTGESVYGICAVSIAVLLGGIGNFTFMEYAKGAYYIFGLGAGMVVAYYLMKAQFSVRREYDIKRRFAVIMTLMGLLCVAMILIGHGRKIFGFAYKIQGDNPFSPNNLATLLMFAMPFPLYLSKKKDVWALLTIVLYAGACLTYSRGALLLGSVEFAVCCVYWIYSKSNKKQRVIAGSLVLLAILLCLSGLFLDVVKDRFFHENIVGSARWVMIEEAVERFLDNPLVGSGILDNTIYYGGYKKAGTMAWYHMMIPQIVGSMGLIGVLAYLFQGLGRIKLIWKDKDDWSLVLGLSYLGILLMSQVNPGEFCPLPFELLTVLLFILQEERLGEKTLPLRRNQKSV